MDEQRILFWRSRSKGQSMLMWMLANSAQVPHLRVTFVILFSSDSSRLLSAYTRTVSRTRWPCPRFDHVRRVRRPYYEFTVKRLRQHVRVQSTPQLEDGLKVWLAINVSQILFDRRRSKPNTISEQPQWFDTLSQCDKITHSSSKEKNSSDTLLVKN